MTRLTTVWRRNLIQSNIRGRHRGFQHQNSASPSCVCKKRKQFLNELRKTRYSCGQQTNEQTVMGTYTEPLLLEELVIPGIEVWKTFYHLFVIVYGINYQSLGRDSSVCIATRYGLDGPGIVTRWRWDFLHPSRTALGPTEPPTQWVPGLFPGVKRPKRGLDHTPHLVPRLKKSRVMSLLSTWDFVACSSVNRTLRFTFHYPSVLDN